MGKRNGSVIVTGDIVLDCHLYGGAQDGKPSRNDRGTQYVEVPGGAALTRALLDATADEQGLVWDEARSMWDEERAARRKANQPLPPRPDDLAPRRPPRHYATILAQQLPDVWGAIPLHLRSYSVWTPSPTDKRDKNQVWRTNRDFGYGPLEPQQHGYQFPIDPESGETVPNLVVIDDAAKGFRHATAKASWPTLDAQDGRYYLLKMTHPIACGDLWEALHDVRERLIVIVSAGDLRRQDIQIDARLSWEQCAEHTLTAVLHDPTGIELRRSAAHVIITFGSAGALRVSGGPADDDVTARLIFDPLRLEGDFEREVGGTTYGFQTAFTVAVAHHLMRFHVGLTSSPRGPAPSRTPRRWGKRCTRGSAPASSQSVSCCALGMARWATRTRGFQSGHWRRPSPRTPWASLMLRSPMIIAA